MSIFPHRHTNLIFSSPINYIFLGTANSAYNIQNCRKQGVCDLGVLVLGDIFILAYRRTFVVPASHSCENAGGQSAVQHIVKAVGIIQKTVGFLEIFFKAVIADSIAKLLCFLYRIFQIGYTLFDIGTAWADFVKKRFFHSAYLTVCYIPMGVLPNSFDRPNALFAFEFCFKKANLIKLKCAFGQGKLIAVSGYRNALQTTAFKFLTKMCRGKYRLAVSKNKPGLVKVIAGRRGCVRAVCAGRFYDIVNLYLEI